MRIFNADGSEARICGNASRCIGKYLYEEGLTNKTDIQLETLSGIKILHLHLNDKNTVESVTVRDVKTGKTKDLPVAGVCIAVGQTPKTDLVKDQVETDEAGFIKADESCKTNLPGGSCAGDIRTKRLRQIVTAVADGAVAADNSLGLGCVLQAAKAQEQ